MNRLVKDGLCPSLSDSSGSCVECCKRNITKTKMKGSIRSADLLEIIHADICGPFPNPTLKVLEYFHLFY